MSAQASPSLREIGTLVTALAELSRDADVPRFALGYVHHLLHCWRVGGEIAELRLPLIVGADRGWSAPPPAHS